MSSLDAPNTIDTAFSETAYNMTPLGDGSGTNLLIGNSGAAETAEAVPVAAPGSVSAPQLQGGFRYLRITLATPGTVTLAGTSVAFSPPLETSDSYAGYFLSNSDQLNKVWFDGAGWITSTAAQDVARDEVNSFIRTSPIFDDGVLDIAATIGQPGNDNFYQPQFDSGDHLHPNTAGYQAIAQAMPLGFLRS